MYKTVLTVVLIAAFPSVGFSQSLTQRIDALRMPGGHLPGAFKQNEGAGGLIWYFSTIGVHSIAVDQRHDRVVRDYLTKYLATATLPGGAINDVHDLSDPRVIKWKVADSDDSYAATIISLACWYSNRPGGDAWFRKHLPQIKFIATANLVDTLNPRYSLVNTFNSQPGRTESLGAKAAYQHVCQTMDNCEAYRALKDLETVLAKLSDADAKVYRLTAEKISLGIQKMYDRESASFTVSTVKASRDFYPHRFIQVAPQVYNVDLGKHTSAYYDAGWKSLNAGGDRWWEGEFRDPADKSAKGASFMMLAYAAALRGETAIARKHLAYFQKGLADRSQPGSFKAIHELGWALRTERLLR